MSRAFILVALVLLTTCLMISVHADDNTNCPADTDQNVIYYNVANTTEGSSFEKNLSSAYAKLLKKAPADGSAQVKLGIKPKNRVYGFAGCFQGDCESCLKTIIGYFQSVAPLSVGARMCLRTDSEACYLRYENYSF